MNYLRNQTRYAVTVTILIHAESKDQAMREVENYIDPLFTNGVDYGVKFAEEQRGLANFEIME